MNSAHLKDNRRHKVVTASNAWNAIYDRKKLWREMTFRAAPFQGSEMTQWGNDHEHVAISEFEKFIDDIVEPGDKLVVHPDLPLAGTCDFMLHGVCGEVKCPFSQRIYPEIPERYYFQMQVQMLVNNAIACHFFVWTPNEFHTELVQRDQDFIDWYIPFAEEFIGYVNSDKEPPRWNKKPVYQPKEK